MPIVSIIMPCWDASETLDEALQSLVTQTFPDWELVAVDDGSCDRTPEILAAWSCREPRIRCVRQAHEGIVAALRRGCRESKGEYWARMDADDVCLPNRLQRQLDCLSQQDAMTLCGTGVEAIGGNIQSGRLRYEGWLNSLTTHEDMARERFIECPMAHPTFMAHRTCFERIGYAEQDGPEDYDFVLRALDAGVRLAKVPDVLLHWRDHPTRACLNDDRYGPERFRELKRRHLKPFLQDGRRFWQWGAGEVGKAWLREWEGPRPERVVDVNPRKFGKRIHGYEIVAPERLPKPGDVVVVIAVGAPGARTELRQWFGERGYVEARDFWFVA